MRFFARTIGIPFVALLVLAGCGSTRVPDPAAGDTGTSPPAKTEPGTSAAPKETVELTVSAAASLTDALKDIEKAYEAKQNHIRLTFNFGASGSLQQQIEQGAPADLFLSAAPKYMQALVDKGLVDRGRQTTLLTNELVVVTPADAQTAAASIADLTKDTIRNVAIGVPASVPAGAYAQEALQKAQLWEALKAKLVQAKDVRQVLQYVETGNADAGFVYKTDTLTSRKVRIAFAVEAGTYTPVEYPAGVVQATKHAPEAEAFYRYLQSPEALEIFARYGFSLPK
ncbi:molybdate ABC transporter substrate-binding protein [Paenibacillus sp. CC-CFT747]|nr:molybdate ABC transporter substrate-binding protein [Paenibacillus sp. CC-CFT747]